MEAPGILVLLLATAAAVPHGPSFRGYFDKAFPFKEVDRAPNLRNDFAYEIEGIPEHCPTADKIADWTPESKSNVWELSGQYEGDIMLSPEVQGSAEAERETIVGALKDFNDSSCVKLVPHGGDITDKNIIRRESFDDSKTFGQEKEPATFIWIQGEPTGCWSMVGRQKAKGPLGDPEDEDDDELDAVEIEDVLSDGKRKKRAWLEGLGLGFLVGDKGPGSGGQVVNLQRPGCVHHGVVVHEVLHALGFFHQQSAHDRDEFVEIVWENIQEVITDFGVPYDYSSVMHYGKTAFSKNGKDTIVPLKKNATIGLRGGMSNGDTAKLIKAYCEKEESSKIGALDLR
ncbi:hypothetical protein J437_LFUL008692 [Ladona fulva]|uniref:Peptidase M12A domain-containing protein n=1 Tax=Ladona fulva TaxID=123851 RepID=A0A8K0KA54_LADFU|nr:hypothetical protein J437_LFUL008692 [Ladona fulva]